MNQETVLVVEDEQDIAYAVQTYLTNQGYKSLWAENGAVALRLLESAAVDLAIVDVMMPIMDGIAFVGEARKRHDFPIIMLSAKSEEIDQITGLNRGADDYVTKPFRPMELLARVNSQLRRARKSKELAAPSHILEAGGLEMNTQTHEFFVDGQPVKLTPTESKILQLFLSNPGQVFPAEEIYERIWGDVAVSTDTIMVHIRKIREKIEFNPKEPRYLKVVWGVGYKLEKPNRGNHHA
ncbi:MAG: response regulator transcription factor [Turicibacter sp.]|nr:response regulator transcription factor [Turicibacter sp.]